MTLSHSDTFALIHYVLSFSTDEAREALHSHLMKMRRTEPEFYAGVLKHGPFMSLTSEQWFEFHTRIPDRLLRDSMELMNKLSPDQRKLLGI